jgi:hypothetical protein
MRNGLHGSGRRNERRPKVFGRVIDLTSAVSERMGGRRIETSVSGMPLDGSLLYSGGGVTTETFLGVLREERFEGQAASNALALSRTTTAPEPPLLRNLTIDERLRRLGIGANR